MADVVRPQSVDELSAFLRESAADRPIVAVSGADTKVGWGGIGPAPDVELSLSALSGPAEHAAGDLVVTVPAGTRLAALQAELAAAGQWLALDPPEADATVGGVVAAAAAGPRRLRYGTPRDLLIGIQVVLADGTVARAGGRVVKNVAGYDLGKLFAGSHGTLGIITECTFRLHPRAAATRVVSVPSDRPAEVVTAIRALRVAPVALEWDGTAVHVVVESSPAAADRHATVIAEAVDGAVADAAPVDLGMRPWGSGEVGLKVTHRIGALDRAIEATRSAFPDARVSAHAGSGVLWAGLRHADADLRGALAALRAATAPDDGTVVVVHAPEDVRAGLDVWGPVRGLDVMQRIKERFDPDRRMNPGRFVGGI